MQGKLYKSPNGEHYYLTVDGVIFAEIGGHPLKSIDQALSLKNCEAIANGYDLDELACNEIGIDISVIKHIDDKIKSDSSPSVPIKEAGAVGSALYHRFKGFEIGFQKALEILGDKKFTKEDMGRIMVFGYDKSTENEYLSRIPFEEYIQSLQQTEWDVIIEMESNLHIGEVVDDSYPKDFPTEKPKLDADGCLILKII
jgi:hypothetical protein